MGDDVVIGVDPMEASDIVKETTDESLRDSKPYLTIKCGGCGYTGSFPTIWRWDLCQLWVFCPNCAQPLLPLKDVPVP